MIIITIPITLPLIIYINLHVIERDGAQEQLFDHRRLQAALPAKCKCNVTHSNTELHCTLAKCNTRRWKCTI
jgi:hypothetical protein